MKQNAIERLKRIMAQLRHPQDGCPWDKVQTSATIAPYTLEETYEVLDAIERNDINALKEELGDLLFHIVFYAQMAQEQQQFDFNDICEAVCDKLERRHPHIFNQQAGISGEEAISSWEQRKAAERAEKDQHSVLDDIPASLPALMKAYKIQKRCASVGFDWDTIGPVLDKVYEEIDEVMDEAKQAVLDKDRLEEELGDLLFSVVNLSRHLGHKPEIALQKACKKFENRFRHVEKLILDKGMSLETATLDEMEAMWQRVKSQKA
ncbi:nucleoside triphosphate pyrophosphohydrolase [Xenorhabdus griffiniae]|uniref:Nucleoside triphosphate pyrophosphohydrolase n=1 Tax=Xenorhabdus griffiniae TaxID=351672 RepID=A0ABY9XK02_9GAMM|nr:nucleoside triphosphate pyrophosphohydrolase [Xenorhabdus griffiniae]MBD1226618.1 nucleoside triphosphate pyrophosphohydrolase [Xenorhabdus griffiniae]MBE8588082.1 nucleoside triphosphate pyrophosphohydrolase [Xenorhabdus griffiniae]WMV73259.1 nucleoside triphosphate pyrophosphohydrolase [Xenorhabdus griffiniae]WNH02938.1 nucleoside triphosphate pyrophosphohydrolase [Xenorhabdus griffiniae]